MNVQKLMFASDTEAYGVVIHFQSSKYIELHPEVPVGPNGSVNLGLSPSSFSLIEKSRILLAFTEFGKSP